MKVLAVIVFVLAVGSISADPLFGLDNLSGVTDIIPTLLNAVLTLLPDITKLLSGPGGDLLTGLLDLVEQIQVILVSLLGGTVGGLVGGIVGLLPAQIQVLIVPLLCTVLSLLDGIAALLDVVNNTQAQVVITLATVASTVLKKVNEVLDTILGKLNGVLKGQIEAAIAAIDEAIEDLHDLVIHIIIFPGELVVIEIETIKSIFKTLKTNLGNAFKCAINDAK